jgi:hypothetical protein
VGCDDALGLSEFAVESHCDGLSLTELVYTQILMTAGNWLCKMFTEIVYGSVVFYFSSSFYVQCRIYDCISLTYPGPFPSIYSSGCGGPHVNRCRSSTQPFAGFGIKFSG